MKIQLILLTVKFIYGDLQKFKKRLNTLLIKKYHSRDYYKYDIDTKLIINYLYINNDTIHLIEYKNNKQSFHDNFSLSKFSENVPANNFNLISMLCKKICNLQDKNTLKMIFVNYKLGISNEFMIKLRKQLKNKLKRMIRSKLDKGSIINNRIRHKYIITDKVDEFMDTHRYKRYKIDHFDIFSHGIIIHIINNKIHSTYKIRYDELHSRCLNQIVVKKSLIKNEPSILEKYLIYNINIPILKFIKGIREDCTKSISNILSIKNTRILFFIIRDIWDMKPTDNFINNTRNYLIVYTEFNTISINEFKYSLEEKHGSVKIEKHSYNNIIKIFTEYFQVYFVYVDYLVFLLDKSNITKIACRNIFKGDTYFLMIHVLYFCEIINDIELNKYRININKKQIDNLINKLIRNRIFTTHKYSKILRYLLYIEINKMWKSYLLNENEYDDKNFFKNTKKLVNEYKKNNLIFEQTNLIEIYENYILPKNNIRLLIDEYDKLLNNVLIEVIKTFKNFNK